jgi:hypothetical protein
MKIEFQTQFEFEILPIENMFLLTSELERKKRLN